MWRNIAGWYVYLPVERPSLDPSVLDEASTPKIHDAVAHFIAVIVFLRLIRLACPWYVSALRDFSTVFLSAAC